ncbi:MAG: glycosyltransferase family 4 protein [Candidatus Bathyarchaeia archaeon]
MKILIFAENLTFRGVGFITRIQVEELSKYNEVFLVTLKGQGKEVGGKVNKVIEFSLPGESFRLLNKYAGKVWKKVQKCKFRPDVVYVANQWYKIIEYANRDKIPSVITINMPWPVCYYGNLWFKQREPCSGCGQLRLLKCIFNSLTLKAKILTFFEYPYALARSASVRSTLSKASRIIAISNTVKKWMSRIGLENKTCVVYLGALMPTSPLVRKETHHDSFVLAYLSYPDVEKGFVNLLLAFKKAYSLNPKLKLKIFGCEKISHLNIPNCEIMPWLPIRSYLTMLPEVLRDVDLVVVPSLYEDAWAGVCTQAMACGIPVLVNPVGGLREQVIDGYNGFTANCYDIDELSKKILEISSLPKSELEAVGQNARKYVLDNFSKEKIIGKLMEILYAASKDIT